MTDDLTVSVMGPSDHQAMIAHRKRSACCWVGKTSIAELMLWDHAMVDPRENVFLLKRGDVVIGSARLALYGNDPNAAQIVPIVIDPSERNKGLGFYFLQWLKQYCVGNAFTTIWLCVDKENHPAIRLYKRSGFEIGDGLPAEGMHEMKLKL